MRRSRNSHEPARLATPRRDFLPACLPITAATARADVNDILAPPRGDNCWDSEYSHGTRYTIFSDDSRQRVQQSSIVRIRRHSRRVTSELTEHRRRRRSSRRVPRFFLSPPRFRKILRARAVGREKPRRCLALPCLTSVALTRCFPTATNWKRAVGARANESAEALPPLHVSRTTTRSDQQLVNDYPHHRRPACVARRGQQHDDSGSSLPPSRRWIESPKMRHATREESLSLSLNFSDISGWHPVFSRDPARSSLLFSLQGPSATLPAFSLGRIAEPSRAASAPRGRKPRKSAAQRFSLLLLFSSLWGPLARGLALSHSHTHTRHCGGALARATREPHSRDHWPRGYTSI